MGRADRRAAGALLCLLFALAGTATRACETALLLAIDVSNSVDMAEYRLQLDGMADALEDGEVVDALVQGQVALAVMQWSGADRQELSLPWTRIRSAADAREVAARARGLTRAFVLSDTAVGEAIRSAVPLFSQVADCGRRVIDISGDGPDNSGGDPRGARTLAARAGITINAIAIEGMGRAVSAFFERAVITADGFVVTARGHRDYPRAIRAKILREVSAALF